MGAPLGLYRMWFPRRPFAVAPDTLGPTLYHVQTRNSPSNIETAVPIEQSYICQEILVFYELTGNTHKGWDN